MGKPVTLDRLPLNTDGVERFFYIARERQEIYLRRQAGSPRPWTTDSIMNTYKFTNLFRELDKTTIWLRKNVRERLPAEELLLATVVFRWFNLITTGEIIFNQPDLLDGTTPWDRFRNAGQLCSLVTPVRNAYPKGRWITGAYMIRSPTGMDKLTGVAKMCADFAARKSPMPGSLPEGRLFMDWREVTEMCLDRRETANPVSLKDVWQWLLPHEGMGPFLAYEVVTDLRHTPLLDRAPDILTWANPGPGARRGTQRLLGGWAKDRYNKVPQASVPLAEACMRELLELSRSPRYWPQDNSKDWPAWEMREPEMWLCEYDKYERVRTGMGRPRSLYR